MPGALNASFSVRRLNHLAAALQCRSYLENGVCEANTILNVAVEKRIGVDPISPLTGASTMDGMACSSIPAAAISFLRAYLKVIGST